MDKRKCKKCSSCIEDYCIEEMKETKEVKNCEKFVSREAADFLCRFMCGDVCEE